MRIPKVIHRIWLDDPMPEPFEQFGKDFQRLHPDWEVVDWTNSDAVLVRLVSMKNQDLFDRAREVCPRDWKRFQSDILRLEILKALGGVYVDTDVEPLRPLDELLTDDVLAFAGWSPNRGKNGRRLLTQCILGSTPDHPWIVRCVDRLASRVKASRNKPLAQMIGPHFVTDVYEADIGGWPGLKVFDEETFFPQSIEQRDRGELVDKTVAYTHHHWNTTAKRRGGGVK